MSQSGRNLIAQALARRALMGGAGMAGERELQPMFGTPAPAFGQNARDLRLLWERQRLERERTPPELLVPDQQLYRDDWVPADQPTSEELEGYYMKRRL